MKTTQAKIRNIKYSQVHKSYAKLSQAAHQENNKYPSIGKKY